MQIQQIVVYYKNFGVIKMHKTFYNLPFAFSFIRERALNGHAWFEIKMKFKEM